MRLYKRLLWAIACVYPAGAHAQYSETQQKAIVLRRMIELNHVNPRAVDDSFSSEMFSKCINELDPHRNLFTATEFNDLSNYRYKLDDELKGSGWAFLDMTSKYYKIGLRRADSLVNRLLQAPFDFSSEDKVTLSMDEKGDFNFSQSTDELMKRWAKQLKYAMLNEIYERHSTDSARLPLKALITKYEGVARQKLRKTQLANIAHILEGFETYMKETYFNAMASCFDPHTMYFSPHEKESFEAAVGTEQYSFGLTIEDDNDGKVVIDRLVPGGPAWKCGELNKDDEVLQVQWQGKEAVDASTLTADEVNEIFNEANAGSIAIKVRKANGSLRTVVLQKEKIAKNDEDVVRGYLLHGKQRIGYISLPDFYTNWEDEKGSGCANDVAKEIVKLKKENIEGLIIDVRFNGGGSVDEALQMIGIFIDEGPLAGMKDRAKKLSFLKDPNRGTIYDGPLLLLVNSQSASASEMLAAALQDYNRAVIAGSVTYGKATMQRLFSPDTLSNNTSPSFRSDVIKITTGKLYRVTGQTAQLKGVTPDIMLPDIFDGMRYREKFSADVLPPDTAKKNGYYQPLAPLPIPELARLSADRVKSSKHFDDIRAGIESEKEIFGDKTVILKPDEFEKWANQRESLEKVLQDRDEYPTTLFVAESYSANVQKMKTDLYASQVDGVVLKNLQQDIYIEEAYNVLCDLIRISTKQ